MVLSCRVLGRGIELAAVDWLARRARAAGATTLQGSYVASSKNGVAAGFWARPGSARPPRTARSPSICATDGTGAQLDHAT